MVIKVVLESSVSRSDYNNLIKRCIREFGHEKANHLGSLIILFRDKHDETKNFKFRIFVEERKYVSFLVKGGWGRLTRSKYLINESAIKRYDWRNNFWYMTVRILGAGLKIAGAIAEFTPFVSSAAPLLRIAGALLGKGAKAIGYDRGYSHSVREKTNECRHFNGNYTQLLSGCCSELWCCSLCHNEKNWHKWSKADYFICLNCSNPKYQKYITTNFTCPDCYFNHSITPICS